MRVLLFTGKGGVGKTTVAAATATLAAERGHKTLVVSTDTAHSLADALDVTVGSEPTEISRGLSVHQVDTQRALERSWGELQAYLRKVLDAVGLDALTAEELTVLPGAEEVLALLELRKQVSSRRWDVVVVDCAPTAETLRLLALPEALNWYVDRLLPIERRVVRTLKPVLNRMAGVPMPADPVFDAIERFHAELAEVRKTLVDRMTSVRLVLTPEAVVVAEARRTLTSLSLYGYRVDAVIANRVFPAADADAWRAAWVEAQTALLAEVQASFSPLPIYQAPYLPAEPIGVGELGQFAVQLYGDADPFAPADTDEPLRVSAQTGQYELSLALPFADRDSVDLARKGDELIVTAGSYRRILALPGALARRVVREAVLRDGRLRVRFGTEGE